ncbi:RING finger protein 17-like, partial [Pseudoliparis swirei]|uniref:RING finger protein 17-like n=1 Tax=Pseudoliparis swirei TaxID=2059687 RepID=UPI0024BD8D75
MRCDHGNQVKLHVSDLRPLPTSLRGSLALECTLTDIRPAGGRPTWSATACDLISFYLTGASAVLTIKELTEERPVPVTLLRSNETGKLVSMADFLVSEGLGLRERKPRVVVVQESKGPEASPGTRSAGSDGEPVPLGSLAPRPRPAPCTITSAEKVETGPYRPPSLPGLGAVSVRVTAVGEDGLVYARTPDAAAAVCAEAVWRRLGERLQQSMKTLPRQRPYTWRTVQGLAVRGPDMLWYRGQLLELLGGHVKVQYVDSGLVENIPVVHVYPTLLCDDTPQLSVSCQLHGIQPVGGRWQCDAVSLLRELLLSRRVDVEVR